KQCGYWHDTVSLFSRNYELNPSSLAGQTMLGVYWSEHDDPNLSLGLLAQSVQDHPDIPFAHFTYANVLLKQKLYDAATREYERAIALDATKPRYYTNLGVALANQGHPDLAILAFQQAARLDPNDPDNFQNAG